MKKVLTLLLVLSLVTATYGQNNNNKLQIKKMAKNACKDFKCISKIDKGQKYYVGQYQKKSLRKTDK